MIPGTLCSPGRRAPFACRRPAMSPRRTRAAPLTSSRSRRTAARSGGSTHACGAKSRCTSCTRHTWGGCCPCACGSGYWTLRRWCCLLPSRWYPRQAAPWSVNSNGAYARGPHHRCQKDANHTEDTGHGAWGHRRGGKRESKQLVAMEWIEWYSAIATALAATATTTATHNT